MYIIGLVIKAASTIALIFLVVLALHFAFGGSDPFAEPCSAKVNSPPISSQ